MSLFLDPSLHMDVQMTTPFEVFDLYPALNESLLNATDDPDVTSVGIQITWSNICIALFASVIIIGTFLGNTMVIAAVLVERRLRKVSEDVCLSSTQGQVFP